MSFLKKNKDLNLDAFPTIERSRVLKGKFIPGIIKNGDSYFFIDLQVFEDGLIECWEMVDLELLGKKIKSGWVSPSVPNGKELSIHHLGSWTIKKGDWLFDKRSLFKHVIEVIKTLNPKLENLYNCFGTTTMKVGNVNVSRFGLVKGKPVRSEDPESYFSPKHKGDSFHSFLKNDESDYSLIGINIFADSSIQISGIEKPRLMSVEEFNLMVKEGEITTALPEGAILDIYGLGKCEIGECLYAADMTAKASEVNDIIARLNGNKTTSEICRDVYETYNKNPTIKRKEALKVAYENIPEHLRVYVLGDMDVKDIPVRMIIYGDQEIKEWSHSQIAKKRGEELPSINIPKPKSDSP